MNIYDLLKSHFDKDWRHMMSDQKRGIAAPPVQKLVDEHVVLIDLIEPEHFTMDDVSLLDAIKYRKSHRVFNEEPLSLNELSFLLWATQGLRQANDPKHRMVPSGAACHPLETYLVINNVTNLSPGIYRYLPLTHQLLCVRADENIMEKAISACGDQAFIGKASVLFVWSAIPYRSEWRFNKEAAAKLIAQDSGHTCQNLYLAVYAIHAGTCAIGAYYQKALDKLLQLDGEKEFSIYAAPVGKVSV